MRLRWSGLGVSLARAEWRGGHPHPDHRLLMAAVPDDLTDGVTILTLLTSVGIQYREE